MGALEQTIQKLGEAFEEFKKTNDERLAKIEKGQPTGDLDTKLTQINQGISALDATKKELDEALKKMQRTGLGGGGDGVRQEVKEHQQAFGKFLRKGDDDGLQELEKKALQIAVGEDGGFAVPDTLDQQIMQMERDEVTMRTLCNVIQLGNENYKKLVNLGGAGSGWVGESEDRPETDSPKLSEVVLHHGEVYANPAATQKTLDDVFFNAEAWLAQESAQSFAEQENEANDTEPSEDATPPAEQDMSLRFRMLVASNANRLARRIAKKGSIGTNEIGLISQAFGLDATHVSAWVQQQVLPLQEDALSASLIQLGMNQ